MGIYLNPGNEKFRVCLNSEIYIDKSKIICYTNKVINTNQRYLCVSRPRRFGKSMTVDMLAAYYSCGCDSDEMFKDLGIAKEEQYGRFRNQYNVILINMQSFLSKSKNVEEMAAMLKKRLMRELLEEYGEKTDCDTEHLTWCMEDIYHKTKKPFVILIDEWDCIFREYKLDTAAQKSYLDFLRDWLKDQSYVALAYMTGILPIKKYGTHSALNMFDEFSMLGAGVLSEYVGFTEEEVRGLCRKYGFSFSEIKHWYDGYLLQMHYSDAEGRIIRRSLSVYNPKSVVSAMLMRNIDNYWNQTETYEALKIYIELDHDGLKDSVIRMMAGERIAVNTGRFHNDMTNFTSAEDVMTLLVHLGYLAYDMETKEVFIPNCEVAAEYANAVEGAGWREVAETVRASKQLLEYVWKKDGDAVAHQIEAVHEKNVSLLKYNDENALSCVITLAFFAAREYYTMIRELPSGKGFADIGFLPRKSYQDKPAMIVELKWNKSAESAVVQIKERNYLDAFEGYKDNLLLVGINYDKETKEHQCRIEEINRPYLEE